MLTLFLGFCKRRAELLAVTGPANSGGHRIALDGYSMSLLDCLIAVSVACAALGYALPSPCIAPTGSFLRFRSCCTACFGTCKSCIRRGAAVIPPGRCCAIRT